MSFRIEIVRTKRTLFLSLLSDNKEYDNARTHCQYGNEDIEPKQANRGFFHNDRAGIHFVSVELRYRNCDFTLANGYYVAVCVNGNNRFVATTPRDVLVIGISRRNCRFQRSRFSHFQRQRVNIQFYLGNGNHFGFYSDRLCGGLDYIALGIADRNRGLACRQIVTVCDSPAAALVIRRTIVVGCCDDQARGIKVLSSYVARLARCSLYTDAGKCLCRDRDCLRGSLCYTTLSVADDSSRRLKFCIELSPLLYSYYQH